MESDLEINFANQSLLEDILIGVEDIGDRTSRLQELASDTRKATTENAKVQQER